MSALSSLLVQDRVLSVTQVEQVLQRQVILGGDLATNLLELGMVREDVLAEYVARVVRMPVLPSAKLDNLDSRMLSLLPWGVVNERRVVPIERRGNSLTVAASGPITVAALDDISFLLSVEISPHLVLEYRLAMALQRYYGIPMNGRSTALQRKLAPTYPVDAKPIVPQQGMAPQAMAQGPDKTPSWPAAVEQQKAISVSPTSADADAIDEGWSAAQPTVVVEPGLQMRHSIDATMKIVHLPRVEPAVREDRDDDTLDLPLPLSVPARAPAPMPTPPPSSTSTATPAPPPPPTASPDSVFPPPSRPPEASGLISFSAAAAQLQKAADRDEILSLLVAFSSQAFDFTALFVVQDGAAHGRVATFRGENPFEIDTVLLPLDKAGAFETVFRTGGYHLGPIGETLQDRHALDALKREVPRSCAIIPLFIRNRLVLMLYGDSGARGVRTNRIAKIAEFGQLVSGAFESLLFKKKYERYAKAASQAPLLATALAPQETHGRAHVEPSLVKSRDFGAFGGRTHPVPSETPEPAPAPAPEPAPEAPAVRVVEPAAMPDPALVSKVEVMTVRASAPPPAATGRTISRSAPATTIPAVAIAPAQPQAQPISRPPAPARSMPYMTVEPSTPATRAEPGVARTVRVEMREEIEHLISRVQERGTFDDAAAKLLADIGEDALAEMAKRFPGPLDCDRYQESSRLKRFGQHGPLLRALLRFGARAAQFIAPLMDSFDSEVRFYATFFFSEIQASEALPGLVRRLFDVDRQIRVVALDIIKRFENQPEFRWAVQEVCTVLLSSNSSLEKKRLAADALGALRDPIAIRPLAEMLGSVDGVLAERCQRALVKITFTDFGFSERRWTSWWEANASFHRIEWALAAVNHRVEEIRQNAIDELRRMVGGSVEWPKGPLDHRLRKEIKRRILLWWEREGRALNPVTAVERMA
jgi:hypothetical protein